MDNNHAHPRAVRPPPASRRNLFPGTSSRRTNPTTIRPDREAAATNIFQQPGEDELVERTPSGEYVVFAPQMGYKNTNMAGGGDVEGEEEAGALVPSHSLEKLVEWDLALRERVANAHAEAERQIIDLYGKSTAHWDAAAIEEEIKIALKSSLRKKVASLEDDKWMFEGEGERK